MAFDPISTVLDIGNKVIDRLWPDPAQRDAAKLELLKMQQTGDLAKLAADTDLAKGQLAINAAEAASTSAFVAGWRPFIGWVCGGALAYHYILQPLLAFIIANMGYALVLPDFDMDSLREILYGMLGLGGMRSVEKITAHVTK